jgi:hypothetical protein
MYEEVNKKLIFLDYLSELSAQIQGVSSQRRKQCFWDICLTLVVRVSYSVGYRDTDNPKGVCTS